MRWAASGSAAAVVAGAMRNYRRIVTVVTARPLEQQVSRDADDDAILACALAARADLIVSGDDDLLVLKSFNGISILNTAQAIKRYRLDE